MKKIRISIFFLVFIFLLFPGEGEAQVSVQPIVISEEGKVRDSFDFTVTIRNEGQANVRLFPLVRDIFEEEEEDDDSDDSPPEDSSDKVSFLSSWVEIKRNRINLGPEEEKELSLTIRIDNDVKPGNYYAALIFARGSTEDEARRNAARFNYPKTLININVEEDIIERMQLINFHSEKESFFDRLVNFSLTVENIGNRDLKPFGSVIIYKSRHGRELDSLAINKEGIFVDAGAKETFEIEWEAEGGFGQYKAVLIGEYGEEARRDIQDTIYFWIIPKELLVVAGGGFLLLLILIFSLFRKKEKKHIPVYRRTATTLDLSSRT